MIKIITIVGARPQFIKAATVSRALREKGGFEEIIVHTGQHFDPNMSEIFFDELKIPKPTYNLNINSLSHGAMTGRMIERIEEIILKEKPHWVLVYGDTNSTIAGALAAKKLHVKVAHIEAGLRSFNMKMPEEVNRILTDRISDILFCPTDTAINNLKKEGYDALENKVVKNGDVMQDAALFYAPFSKAPAFEIPEKFVLMTLHRAENTDDLERLKSIISAANTIHKEVPVILLTHPRTKHILTKENISLNVQDEDPVGYLEMIYMLKNCQLVMTDSGGLQKEAFFFGKNCLTLREETEWIELVEHGFNLLAGADESKIQRTFDALKNKKNNFDIDLYGNGKASEIIAETLHNSN